MGVLKAYPNGGINRIFPEHRMVSEDVQKVRSLINCFSLNGKIYKFPGASRIDSTAKSGFCRWAKRIYFQDTGQRKRYQFSAFNKRMYLLDEDTGNLNQVSINGGFDDVYLNNDGFYRDATLKISETVTTYLVDGEYMFKYDGNNSGNWDRVAKLVDVDGNELDPVDIVEYLDRAWVIVKNQNRIYFSENLNPEIYNDATDSGFIELPPGNGNFPTALITFRGYLYVFHGDYFTPISGTTPTTFGLPPGNIIWGYGTKARRSVIKLKNTIVFLNSDDNEIYETGGTLDSTSKIPLSQEIDLKSLINPNKTEDTTACVNDNVLHVSYVKTGENELNAEIMYSIVEQKWCGQGEDRHVAVYCLWKGEGDKGELIIGRSDQGLLMKTGVGLNYDGLATHYKVEFASYLVSDIEDVIFERFWLDGKPTGQHYIPMYYYVDTRITTRGGENVYMEGEGMHLGLIRIADQNIFLNEIIPKINKNRGRCIRFMFEETILNRDFEIYGVFAKYNAISAKSTKYILGN